MLTYSLWIINGQTVDVPNSNRLRITSLEVNARGGTEVLEFVEGIGACQVPSLDLGSEVVLVANKNAALEELRVVFRGRVSQVTPGRLSPGGWIHAYTALGLRWDARYLRINNPSNGMNFYKFNLPEDDPDYNPSETGLNVGQCVKEVLQDNASQLASVGISIDNIDDFDDIDWTPPGPIEISGDDIFNAIESFLEVYAPNHVITLEHKIDINQNVTTNIRCHSLSNPPIIQHLRMGEDFIQPVEVTRSLENCATRVQFIGDSYTEGFYLSLLDETLEPDWTSQQESNWNLDRFDKPGDLIDRGNVVSMTETMVRVRSDNENRTWPSNFWAGLRRGRIRLEADLIDLPTQRVRSQQTRAIQTHDALTAGGNSDIIVQRPFTGNYFSRYTIYALGTDDELGHVFRRYKPRDVEVRQNLAKYFAFPEVYLWEAISQAVLTRAPMGFVVVDGIRYQMVIEIDTNAGTITFAEPTVSFRGLNDPIVLRGEPPLTGNQPPATNINLPEDVLVFVPVRVDPLTVSWPPNDDDNNPVFAGTGKDWFNFERTLVRSLNEWRDFNADTQLEKYAKEIHDSVKDVGLTANVEVHGYRLHDFFPLRRAITLDAVQGQGGSPINFGDVQNFPIPLYGLRAVWGGPDGINITLSLSNERKPLTGDSMYMHGISAENITNNPYNFTDEQAAAFNFASAMTASTMSDVARNAAYESSGRGVMDRINSVNRNAQNMMSNYASNGAQAVMKQNETRNQARQNPASNPSSQSSASQAPMDDSTRSLSRTLQGSIRRESSPGPSPGIAQRNANAIQARKSRLEADQARMAQGRKSRLEADKARILRGFMRRYGTTTPQSPIP